MSPMPDNNKYDFYQLIIIESSDFKKLTDDLKSNEINYIELLNINSKYIIIVYASAILSRLLRKHNNYQLLVFNNNEIIGLINEIIKKNYIIEYIDLLDINNLRDDELGELDELYYSNNINGVIDFIKKENLQIKNFKSKQDKYGITFHRSGLLYSNYNIKKLNSIFKNLVKKIFAGKVIG